MADRKNTRIKNCYLSHRNAILKAKELGWPYVCIFEDDAYPRTDIVRLLNFYLSDVPDKCNLLILGNYRLMEFSLFNQKFYNHVVAWGSHAYVVFQKGYDQYLSLLDSVKIADCYQRMDRRYINSNTFFVPKKNLFIQYSPKKGISGIAGYLWHCFGKRLTNEEIFARGFQPIEQILKEGT